MKRNLRAPLLSLASLSLAAAAADAAVVFSDDFESPNASTSYNITNTSGLVDTTKWVRTTTGAFGATRSGIVGDDRDGENFTDPSPTGTQAYALRYSSNTGLTSAFEQIGTLAVGQTITLTFDVTQQQWNSGTIYTGYLAQLVLFDGASTRNVVSATGLDNTFAVLARATGDATGTDYDTVSLSYTVGNAVFDNNGATAGVATTYLDTFVGKDIAIRFGGNGYSALIDNVSVSITTIPEPRAALLGGIGLVLLMRRRR